MEVRRVGSANFDQNVFRLVPVDLSGDEVDSLPFLYGRLESHVSNVV
jgi:hypothetical protein